MIMKKLLAIWYLMAASLVLANETELPPRYPPIPSQVVPPASPPTPVAAPIMPVAQPMPVVRPVAVFPARSCNILVIPIFDPRGYFLYNRYICR